MAEGIEVAKAYRRKANKKGKVNVKMFKDLVIANRSYRGYDESYKMSREELLELVDCARLSPCSVNAQPFKYFLAWESKTVHTIQSLTKWAAALPNLQIPHEGMCPTGFIVICQDREVSDSLAAHQKDLGIAAQTMLLAAAEKELGGCIIASFSPEKLKSALHLAENLTPVLVVAVGKPIEKIVLTEIEDGESTKYYRDEHDVHYVPKRKLEDIIV